MNLKIFFLLIYSTTCFSSQQTPDNTNNNKIFSNQIENDDYFENKKYINKAYYYIRDKTEFNRMKVYSYLENVNFKALTEKQVKKIAKIKSKVLKDINSFEKLLLGIQLFEKDLLIFAKEIFEDLDVINISQPWNEHIIEVDVAKLYLGNIYYFLEETKYFELAKQLFQIVLDNQQHNPIRINIMAFQSLISINLLGINKDYNEVVNLIKKQIEINQELINWQWIYRIFLNHFIQQKEFDLAKEILESLIKSNKANKELKALAYKDLQTIIETQSKNSQNPSKASAATDNLDYITRQFPNCKITDKRTERPE